MSKREECIAQAKADLLEDFIYELMADSTSLDIIEKFKALGMMETEVPWDAESRLLSLHEASNSSGIGWVEVSLVDEEAPAEAVIVDVMPCVWMNGSIYDADNEPWCIEEIGEGNMLYNKWGNGFRIWTDGPMPTVEKREMEHWAGNEDEQWQRNMDPDSAGEEEKKGETDTADYCLRPDGDGAPA